MATVIGAVNQVSRETLRTRVYDELRLAITKGKFEPGQALTVRGLAEAFGTSPTPVREALQQLTAERALVAEPNKSYRIPVMTRDRFLDLRDTRAAVEGLAAEKAALRITDAELKRLGTINDRVLRAIQRQDAKTYLSANEDFHFAIYEAAEAPVLLQTIRSLWLQIGPTLNLLFQDMTLVRHLDDHHQAALDALSRHNPRAARDAIQKDIRTAGAYLADLLVPPARR